MIDNLGNKTFVPVKLSRNLLNHVIEAANPAMTSRVGLKYQLAIKVPAFEGSNTFVELYRSQLREKPPYTIGGSTIFEGAATIYNNKNGKLDSLLKIQKPSLNLLEPTVITTQTMKYILREIVTGGTPAAAIDRDLSPQWVMKAGISNIDFQTYGETLFSSYQSANRRFLTNATNRKVIGKTQTEYLSFLMNMTEMPNAVRLRLEMDNGDTNTYLTVQSPPFMSVVMFPVNHKNLSLGDDCKSFKVWLSDENNARLSEVRTYYIDPIDRAQERFIIFSNSLGGWDTLRLTGESTEAVKTSQAGISKDKSVFDVSTLSNLQIIKTESDRELAISTGYFERNIKANLAWLEELLDSEDVYLVTEKGHQQLQKLTNGLILKEDNFGNVARTLQFRFVDYSSNYSNLPVAAATPSRPTGWAAFGNQVHVLNSFGKRTGYKKSESLIKVYTDVIPFEKVRPNQIKANIPGTEGYISQYFDASVIVGSTPYPNALYSRQTTYAKNDCGVGFDGLKATISIAANTYGGENIGDADLLAIAAANALDTQAYANLYGGCTPIGPVYNWNVPANHWHYRVKEPSKMSILFENSGGWGEYPAGTDSTMQGQSGQYIYPVGSNDVDFPVSGPPNFLGWNIKLVNYAPNANLSLRFYRNGTLIFTRAITTNSTGAWEGDGFSDGTVGYPPNNGDKTYWEVV